MSKNGGTFADAGSVSYLFHRKGEIRLDKGSLDEDKAMELALDSGAEDVQEDDQEWIIYTAVDQLFNVGNALQARRHTLKSQQLTYIPSTTVTLTDVDTAKAFLKLYDALDDYDDTQHIHANFEISDDVLASLS